MPKVESGLEGRPDEVGEFRWWGIAPLGNVDVVGASLNEMYQH